jgi:hypothetical protein
MSLIVGMLPTKGFHLQKKKVGTINKKIKKYIHRKNHLIYGIVKRLLPFNHNPQFGIFSNSKLSKILVMGIFHYQRSCGFSFWG